VESYVCRIISSIAECYQDTTKIEWSYYKEKYIVDFFNAIDERLCSNTYPIKLKIENLRMSSLDEKQANTAVHESGHAVLSSLIIGIVPDEVVSMTAGMHHGFCRTEMPEFKTKSLYEKDIITSLGGYVAETLIFGDDNLTDGSYSDIEHASHMAIEYFRSMGMSGVPVKISAPDINMNAYGSFSYEQSDEMAKKLILECKEKAKKCLKDNMLLLLKLSEYLSIHPKMNKEQLTQYVQKYNSYGATSFKDKESYYGFRKMLNDKLVDTIKTSKKRKKIQLT
jgi:cell division protease FtsH